MMTGATTTQAILKQVLDNVAPDSKMHGSPSLQELSSGPTQWLYSKWSTSPKHDLVTTQTVLFGATLVFIQSNVSNHYATKHNPGFPPK
eukprot:3642133-Amphidinium_carterae.2